MVFSKDKKGVSRAWVDQRHLLPPPLASLGSPVSVLDRLMEPSLQCVGGILSVCALRLVGGRGSVLLFERYPSESSVPCLGATNGLSM